MLLLAARQHLREESRNRLKRLLALLDDHVEFIGLDAMHES